MSDSSEPNSTNPTSPTSAPSQLAEELFAEEFMHSEPEAEDAPRHAANATLKAKPSQTKPTAKIIPKIATQKPPQSEKVTQKQRFTELPWFERHPIVLTLFLLAELGFKVFVSGWAKLSTFRKRMAARWRRNGYRPAHERPFYFLDSTVMELRRTLAFSLSLVVAAVIIGLASVTLVVALIWPKLPSLEQITQYEPVLPMQVFSSDGLIMGEFGNEHRTFTPYQDFPKHLVHALVAAEDQRFFTHSGFDPVGLARAFVAGLSSGRGKGTSTLTQQLARNFYLTQEKTIWRKLVELMLAVKIEQELTKEKILEVYMNQIYLGERSFGFASAAATYFNKDLSDLTISECAILAGLPKFPSVNPVTRPKRVLERRVYTLKRMLEDGYINKAEHDQALIEPLSKAVREKTVKFESNFIAEMARQYLIDLLRAQRVENPEELAYSKGFRVTTSIRSDWQMQAEVSLQKGLIDFEIRHGFRGPEVQLKITGGLTKEEQRQAIEDQFDELTSDKWLTPAVVTEINDKMVGFYIQGGETFNVEINNNSWLKNYLNHPPKNAEPLVVGAVVRVYDKLATKKGKNDDEAHQWVITQLPKVEGGLVAINPNDGRVEALVGGYSYTRSQFNHITQAWRQPGSTFKPFIYSAAIERGIGAGDIYEDKALAFPQPDGSVWKPKNYDGSYQGPITVRNAMAKSLNSVMIQLLDQVSVNYAHQYISRFGFDPKKIPKVLSMGLGSGEVTPMQMAAAYGEFANGGYRVQPWIIREVRDVSDKVYYQYDIQDARQPENLVLDPRNVYIMDSMLKTVATRGTGARIGSTFHRPDLAGKTGTTNEYVDAWFCGYHPNLVSVVWVGYDKPAKLGRGATGGQLALPIWIDFMRTPLKTLPEVIAKRPDNIGEYNSDLILKEFEKPALPSALEPWETWGSDPNHDWESDAPSPDWVDPRSLLPPNEPQSRQAPNPPPQSLPPVRFF